jgi:hypothetical protein
MQVNVTVEDIESVDLATVVETRSRYDSVGEREDYEVTIGHLIAEKVTQLLAKDDSWGGVKRRFLEIREEGIREAVQPLIAEALTGAIQKTNNYGEPTGQTTSMRELVMVEAQKIVSKPIDSYGRGETFLQKLVREEIGRVFAGELSKVMAAEKEKVVAAVRAKAADLIAEAVKQGVR